MLKDIAELVQRLNLGYPQSVLGAHFPDIIALLAIVFGGSFLIYAWKHRSYFLGVTGFLVGGWAGLMLKMQFSPGGDVTPFLYLGLCSIGGAYIAIVMQRFVGMLLGGFTVAVMMMVFCPSMMDPEKGDLSKLAIAFLLGGGLGAMVPKLFFVFNCSLIGACFVTYGISQAILNKFAMTAPPEILIFIHVAVFLPLVFFGMIYQLSQKDEEPQQVKVVMAPQN